VLSGIQDLALAPRQSDEGAPPAVVEIYPAFRAAAADLRAGDQIIILTWLDRARRDLLSVVPRGECGRPPAGVFATRSASRPNPIGLHEVRVTAVEDLRIRVDALEAVEGTPVLDLKPVLGDVASR
jgi:tRNA-Thr(GGU) m(6)t(6)A37 methyltransferase TsaA